MWFAILVTSKSGNHIVHNYHTMVENDTLINQDSAHIIVLFVVLFWLLNLLILRNVSMKLLKRED